MNLYDLIAAAMQHHTDLTDAAAAGAAIASRYSVQSPDPVEQPREWLHWFRSRKVALEATEARLR